MAYRFWKAGTSSIRIKTVGKTLGAELAVLAILTTGCALKPDETEYEGLMLPGAAVVRLADGYRNVEGPASTPDGSVYFTWNGEDRIYRWTRRDGVTLHIIDSRGANGLYVALDGSIIACCAGTNELVEFSPDGAATVLADSYEGAPFNGPNDCWAAPDDGIYFTDPHFDRERSIRQDTEGVYYLPPGRGRVVRVADDLDHPNGVIGTPDGRTLYVTATGEERTWSYRIRPDGSLADKTLFAETGYDGMTVDEDGNVYITDGAGVTIFSENGEKLAQIPVPETASNVCFGGPDMKTLFITAQTSVYVLRMGVRGVR